MAIEKVLQRVRFVEECIEIIELSLLKLVRRDAF